MQTKIRLLLEEQYEQGFHCLLFHLHVSDKIPLASLFDFEVNYRKCFGVRKIRNFTVYVLKFTLLEYVLKFGKIYSHFRFCCWHNI